MVIRNGQETTAVVPQMLQAQHKFPRTGKRGVPQQFPRRLYEMLETETKHMETSAAYLSVITWSLSGKAFRIVNVPDFASTILPKYFRTTKFSSFQRNLNLYGFAKVRHGADTDMYAHPFFFRNNPEALVELRKVTGPVTTLAVSATPTDSDETNSDLLSAKISVDAIRKVSFSYMEQNEKNRSVSPSYSSSSSSTIYSPTTTPLDTVTGCKLFVPSCSSISDLIVAAPTLRLPVLVSPTSSTIHRQVVGGQNSQTSQSTSDRGRLDLLTLALEYECRKIAK